jgi:hypothetical protein
MSVKSSSAQGNGIKALFALKSLDLSGSDGGGKSPAGRPLSAGNRSGAKGGSSPSSTSQSLDGGDDLSGSASVEQRLSIVRRGRGSRDGADTLGLPTAAPVSQFPRFSGIGAEPEGAVRAVMMEVLDAGLFPDVISL